MEDRRKSDLKTMKSVLFFDFLSDIDLDVVERH